MSRGGKSAFRERLDDEYYLACAARLRTSERLACKARTAPLFGHCGFYMASSSFAYAPGNAMSGIPGSSESQLASSFSTLQPHPPRAIPSSSLQVDVRCPPTCLCDIHFEARPRRHRGLVDECRGDSGCHGCQEIRQKGNGRDI